MGRHGRKNRDKLRAWKGKHDPAFQERMRRAAMNRTDPETGRLLLFKNYADRELLVMTGGDQDNPELEWMHYDAIAQRNRDSDPQWISRRMSRRFGLDASLEQRCWYTGTQMYLVPWALYESLNRMTPWRCSHEHLVCERNGGGRGPNLVLAGSYINDKLGHSPLPLKLLHRQEFAKKDFDRETPTWDAIRPWLDAIIDLELQYQLGDHYPWQPWAFDEGTDERRTADAFHAEMRAEEETFLALPEDARAQWLDEFQWRW
jgi:hypothetical protein